MQTPIAPPNLLTPNEATVELRCSRATLYRIIKTGDLVPTIVGKRLRIERTEIDRYLARGRGDVVAS